MATFRSQLYSSGSIIWIFIFGLPLQIVQPSMPASLAIYASAFSIVPRETYSSLPPPPGVLHFCLIRTVCCVFHRVGARACAYTRAASTSNPAVDAAPLTSRSNCSLHGGGAAGRCQRWGSSSFRCCCCFCGGGGGGCKCGGPATRPHPGGSGCLFLADGSARWDHRGLIVSMPTLFKGPPYPPATPHPGLQRQNPRVDWSSSALCVDRSSFWVRMPPFRLHYYRLSYCVTGVYSSMRVAAAGDKPIATPATPAAVTTGAPQRSSTTTTPAASVTSASTLSTATTTTAPFGSGLVHAGSVPANGAAEGLVLGGPPEKVKRPCRVLARSLL